MRIKVVCWVLFLLLVPISSVLAQTPEQLFTSQDGMFSFKYPTGWLVETVNADQGPAGMSFVVDNLPLEGRFENPDGLSIQIYFPQQRAAFAAVGGGTTPVQILNRAKNLMSITPTTPQAQDQIIEFTVNGLPAARLTIQYSAAGIDVSMMEVVLDVGNDYLVIANVTSFKGGITTIRKYESVVVAIAETIRYALKTVTSGNADLPQVYSGKVGIWQRGTIKFYYPANWVVYVMGTQILQNTSEPVNSNAPKAGQVVAMIQGPSETRASVDPNELSNQCGTARSDWTARKIVEKALTLSASQLQQLKDKGITISKPIAVTMNGKEIIYLYVYQGDVANLQIFVDLGNGNVPELSAFAKRGEMGQFEKQLLAIAATFEYTPNPCVATPTAQATVPSQSK